MVVLVLGSRLSDNLEGFVCSAFREVGEDPRFVGYADLLRPLAVTYARLSTRVPLVRSVVTRSIHSRMWNRIDFALKDCVPRLILVLKGEGVDPELVSRLAKRYACPKILWYPDDPMFFKTYVRYVANAYDMILTFCERGIVRYRDLGVRAARVVPFACSPSVHSPPAETTGANAPGYDAVFVGTCTSARIRMVRRILREGIDVHAFGPFWRLRLPGTASHEAVYGQTATDIYHRAKVVLNLHTNPGWGPNMRVFEVTGCGSLLLTDYVEQLENYFQIGTELDTFSSLEELVAKIRFYLSKADRARDIASAGQRRCARDHTYAERVTRIMQCSQELLDR